MSKQVQDNAILNLALIGEINSILSFEQNPSISQSLKMKAPAVKSLKGASARMRELIENGANPNCAGNNGVTALHLAVMAENHQLFQYLLEKKADVLARCGNDEKSALHLIVRDSRIFMLFPAFSSLREPHFIRIDRNKVNICDRLGNNLFHEFLHTVYDRFVAETLVLEGVNLQLSNSEGTIPEQVISSIESEKDWFADMRRKTTRCNDIEILFIRLKAGFGLSLVKVIPQLGESTISEPGENVIVDKTITDSLSEISRLMVFARDNPEVLKRLMEGSLNVIAMETSGYINNPYLPMKALHCENALKVIEEIVLPLIDLGVSPDSKDDKQNSLLHLVAHLKDPRRFGIIVAKGGSASTLDQYNRTAIECLESFGLQPEFTDEEVYKLIKSETANKRDERLLHILIKNHANKNWQFEDGKNLLHLLSENNLPVSMMAALIVMREGNRTVNSDIVNARDFDGNTPLHCAMELEDSYRFLLTKMLVNEGARSDIANNAGRIVADIVQEKGDENCVNEIAEVNRVGFGGIESMLFSFDTHFEICDAMACKGMGLENTPFHRTVRENLDITRDILLKELQLTRNQKDADACLEWCLSSLGISEEGLRKAQNEIARKQFLFDIQYLIVMSEKVIEYGATANLSDQSGKTISNYKMEFLANRTNSNLDAERLTPIIKEMLKLNEGSASRKRLKTEKKAAASPINPIPPAPPKEPVLTSQQIWSQHLTSLQKANASISSRISADLNRILDSESEEDAVNLEEKFIGETALMTFVRNGALDLTRKIIAKGADVNFRNRKDESPLYLSFVGQNFDLIKANLMVPNLRFDNLAADLLKGVLVKDAKFAESILKMEELVTTIAQAVNSKGRDALIRDLRNKATKENKLKNSKTLRAEIANFENAIITKEKEIIAQKALQQRSPEDLELKLMRQEESYKRRSDVFLIRQEEAKIAAELQRKEDDERAENLAKQQVEVVVKTVAPQDKDVTQAETFVKRLSRSASEFKPPEQLVKKILRDNQTREVQHFLTPPRNKVKSLDDIPLFLAEIFSRIIEDGHQVILKGSAIYQARNNPRIPPDLDIEIVLKSGTDYTKIQDIANKYFGEEVDRVDTYFGYDQTINRNVFTGNLKDSRGLDLSFYHQDMMPPEHLSWTFSKEKRIVFQRDETTNKVTAHYDRTQGFKNYVAARNIIFDENTELFFNPMSRGLIKRACFLYAIGHFSEEQIFNALPDLLPQTPKMLLVKELKADIDSVDAEQRKFAADGMAKYTANHAVTGEYEEKFYSIFEKLKSLTAEEIQKISEGKNADKKGLAPRSYSALSKSKCKVASSTVLV